MSQNNKMNFSDKNVKLLINLTKKLKSTLNKANIFVYDYLLDKIENSAIAKNHDDFINYVINDSIFGGFGALWEIYIENTYLRTEFNEILCSYIDLLLSMGIKNDRIDQIREILPKMK